MVTSIPLQGFVGEFGVRLLLLYMRIFDKLWVSSFEPFLIPLKEFNSNIPHAWKGNLWVLKID